MAYRKFSKRIQGDENQQNEIASHNRVNFNDSGSLKLLTAWLCVLVTAALIFVAIIHLALLETLVIATFVGVVVLGWIIALSFTIRHVSTTSTHVAIEKTERSHALLQAHILHASENYAIFRDEQGSIQFRGTTVLTENRQFLPITTSAPPPQEAILECFDKGMSGRSIEKWLKANGDKKTSYREISKTLDLYRPDWNKKGGVVDSESTAEE